MYNIYRFSMKNPKKNPLSLPNRNHIMVLFWFSVRMYDQITKFLSGRFSQKCLLFFVFVFFFWSLASSESLHSVFGFPNIPPEYMLSTNPIKHFHCNTEWIRGRVVHINKFGGDLISDGVRVWGIWMLILKTETGEQARRKREKNTTKRKIDETRANVFWEFQWLTFSVLFG